MNIDNLYSIFKECHNAVSIDSRNCPKDSLFIALKGDKFDGNKFAKSALENGAKYAIIDDVSFKVNDEQYILVNNTLETLQKLANHHRRILNTPILAITGTNGKTTTKELIATVLNTKFNVQFTKGNLNNHIGVPLTLLSITEEHNLAVVEMGANHPKEIAFLCRIAEPNYGIITNVGKAHLEGFGSLEGVIKTKSELYDFLRMQKESVVFVHKDNAILSEKAQGIPTLITYGSTQEASIVGRLVTDSFTLKLQWYKQLNDKQIYTVKTHLVGDYNLSNALAAIAIGNYFGVSENSINSALENYIPQNNRSQYQKSEKNALIIDTYNANPTSMLASLKSFLNTSAAHKVLILGDMRELGIESILEHQKIIDFLNGQEGLEKVFLVGDEFGKTQHNFMHYNDVTELKAALATDKLENKTIFIKGSNGIKLYDLIDIL